MGQITGIHHVALTVKPDKFDETIKFYTEILGMEIFRAWGEGDGRMAMVSTGDNSVMEIMCRDDADNTNAGPMPHIAFSTDAVDELVESVRKAGYEITKEPMDLEISSVPPMPVRIAFCYGPAHEEIEFFKVYK